MTLIDQKRRGLSEGVFGRVTVYNVKYTARPPPPRRIERRASAAGRPADPGILPQLCSRRDCCIVFAARCHAFMRGLCRHAVSVRPSVCLVHTFCRNK